MEQTKRYVVTRLHWEPGYDAGVYGTQAEAISAAEDEAEMDARAEEWYVHEVVSYPVFSARRVVTMETKVHAPAVSE